MSRVCYTATERRRFYRRSNCYRVVLARARQHWGDLTAIRRPTIALKPLRGTGLGWEPLTRADTAIEGMVGREEGESASGSESESARAPDSNEKVFNTMNFIHTSPSELKLVTLRLR